MLTHRPQESGAESSELPGISVIIPVLNDAEGLRRCLRSLRRDGVPSSASEVIVVDNGSTDGTLDVARHGGASTLVFPRLRVGELRNKGAQAACRSILAFVDADQEIVGGWIDAACALLSEDGVVGAGAPYLSPATGTWVQAMYGRLRGRPSGRHETEWLGSGNLAVRRKAFLQIGGFDTDLETCEDVDLCQRLRAAGWRLVSDERLANVHHGDPRTLRSLFRSELWRGRDNIKVSLRHLTLRGLPSLLIPVADLVCIGIIAISLIAQLVAATVLWAPLWLAFSCAAVITMFAVFRAARMTRSVGSAGLGSLAEAFVVAATYDVARALALVLRQPHRHVR